MILDLRLMVVELFRERRLVLQISKTFYVSLHPKFGNQVLKATCMITGLGIDIVEISRIKSSYDKFKTKFCSKILTKDELNLIPANPIPFLASRFAAKEAAVKALGTGFRNGITFQDISVTSDVLGKPCLHFHNAALQLCQQMNIVRIHLSISHSRDNAVAVVILEQ